MENVNTTTGLLKKALALENQTTPTETSPPPSRGREVKSPKDKTVVATEAKVAIPISVQLITIITVLVIVSLGLLTGLMSFFVTRDVGVTAENNNMSINQKTAAATETLLSSVRVDVQMFLNTVEGLQRANLPDPDGETGATISNVQNYFFRQKKDIAAIMLIKSGTEGSGTASFVNSQFFEDNELDDNVIESFMSSQQAVANRAMMGQVLLRNATPAFSVPLLVMFFPWQTEIGNRKVVGEDGQPLAPMSAVVFFSSENLTENFGSGANSSFMINDEGNILVHSDQTLAKENKSFRSIAYIQAVLDGRLRNAQSDVKIPYVDERNVEYFADFQRISIGKSSGNATVFTIIQRDVVFEGIQMTTLRNIYLSAAALFLAILFIYFFSHSISRPLKLLSWGADEIEEGRYHANLAVTNRDETGVLTYSFNSMSTALANFERFTNKAIVAMARKGRLSLGGAYKSGTVCFAFIRDFSEMAEGFDAQEVVSFVNAYLQRMVPCITGTRGEVDKFLTQGGVVIMALWGTLETAGSPEKDALNAVKGVLMMRASLRCLNEERQKQGQQVIKMGCGINSGDIVAGQMGSSERMEYTVIGDTVNFAARVEGPNDAFDTDILITEDTWNKVGQYLVTEEMPSFEVKGKEKPVRVFAVVNMKSEAGAEVENLLNRLQDIPGNDMNLVKRCVGPEGPATLAEVRERWIS